MVPCGPWDRADGKELRRIIFKNSEKVNDKYQMDVVQTVGFSPDGRALAALGWTPRHGIRMSIWDCETGDTAPQLAWNTTTTDMPNYGDESSFREVRPIRRVSCSLPTAICWPSAAVKRPFLSGKPPAAGSVCCSPPSITM